MKRERIREDVPRGNGNDPDAAKPLTAFRQITAVCGDCGHVKKLDRAGLGALVAVPNLGTLARLAYCSACRQDGAIGPANLTFHPELLEPRPAAPAVRWSKTRLHGGPQRPHRQPSPPERLRRPTISRRSMTMPRATGVTSQLLQT